jgi:putative ABC transport system permease protein
MSIAVVVLVALRALRRNAMRTALTALGIVIGVAAVIVMVAIGAGAQQSIEGQIRSAGSNIVVVMAGSGSAGPVRLGQGNVTTLLPADAEAVRAEVAGFSPGINLRTQVVSEAANWGTQVQGTGAPLPVVRSWPVEMGAYSPSRT